MDRHSTNCNLIGFCGASLQAYAAVVYLMMKRESVICLVASKTRVAPLQTIPRLELISTLLAKLMFKVSQALGTELYLGPPQCYTDSKIVLYWIKGEHQEWKQFVQNCAVSIRSLQAPQYWNPCDGVSNSADIPLRGRNLSDPAMLALWLNGPDWLRTGVKIYQPAEIMPDECVAEMKYLIPEIQTLLTAETCEIISVLRCEDFCTLRRLIRVTDQVITFIDALKLKTSHHLNISHNPEGDTSRVEAYWIRINQQQLVSNTDFPVWKHQLTLSR